MSRQAEISEAVKAILGSCRSTTELRPQNQALSHYYPAILAAFCPLTFDGKCAGKNPRNTSSAKCNISRAWTIRQDYRLEPMLSFAKP